LHADAASRDPKKRRRRSGPRALAVPPERIFWLVAIRDAAQAVLDAYDAGAVIPAMAARDLLRDLLRQDCALFEAGWTEWTDDPDGPEGPSGHKG